MIYAGAISVPILFSLLVQQKREKIQIKNSKIIISHGNIIRFLMVILSILFPLMLSVFRYGIGTDYFYTYIPQFKKIISGGESYYEIGFYWFNKFIGMFTSNGQVLIAVTSLIFIGIVYREIYRSSQQYWLSILLFYLSFVYFISLNNIRQSMASAILLIALTFLIKEHRIGFICCVMVAASIHQIAIIFLLFLLIEKIQLSSISYTILAIGFWGACKFIVPLVLIKIVEYIPRLKLYYVADELSIYSNKTIGTFWLLVQIIIMLYLNYIDIIYKPNKSKNSIKDYREWNIIKLNQCLLLCVCAMDGIVPATYRIVRMFSFSQFLFIPNIVYKYEKNKPRRLIQVIFIISIFTILFIENLIAGSEEVFPYTSIFSAF